MCRPSYKIAGGSLSGVPLWGCGTGRPTAALAQGVGLAGTSCVAMSVCCWRGRVAASAPGDSAQVSWPSSFLPCSFKYPIKWV